MTIRLVAISVVLCFALAPSVYAQQTTAQLSGVVTDESGGALPGVEVTVTQMDTGGTRFAITGGRGEYLFTNLPIGPYKLAATLTGFTTYEQTGIVLTIGDTRAANVSMKVGALTETVLVVADANLVETRSLAVGTLVAQDIDLLFDKGAYTHGNGMNVPRRGSSLAWGPYRAIRMKLSQ